MHCTALAKEMHAPNARRHRKKLRMEQKRKERQKIKEEQEKTTELRQIQLQNQIENRHACFETVLHFRCIREKKRKKIILDNITCLERHHYCFGFFLVLQLLRVYSILYILHTRAGDGFFCIGGRAKCSPELGCKNTIDNFTKCVNILVTFWVKVST